jgi:2-keto-4-pentenoate hydratase/2-oxohepta-3-ene-1,7-dioic acid hydratase in catechol pathway
MRLVSFEARGNRRYGVLTGDGIIDMSARTGSRWPDLLSVLRAGELPALQAEMRGAAADLRLADVTLLPPVPNPEKIICVGVNYLGRTEEFRDPQQHPYPSLFYRAPDSLVGHRVPLVRPRATNEFDYEGEIALVIGRTCRYVAPESALDVVIGATLCNEGTVHDWLSHGRRNNTPGKNFDRSGSIGPCIVTRDEVDLAAPLQLSTTVNGELRQQDTTRRMMFSFQELIAYVTSFATLKPGDILVTGTPTGSGRFFQPPRWLTAGDVVEVAVPELGLLRNRVTDEERGLPRETGG